MVGVSGEFRKIAHVSLLTDGWLACFSRDTVYIPYQPFFMSVRATTNFFVRRREGLSSLWGRGGGHAQTVHALHGFHPLTMVPSQWDGVVFRSSMCADEAKCSLLTHLKYLMHTSTFRLLYFILFFYTGA